MILVEFAIIQGESEGMEVEKAKFRGASEIAEEGRIMKVVVVAAKEEEGKGRERKGGRIVKGTVAGTSLEFLL